MNKNFLRNNDLKPKKINCEFVIEKVLTRYLNSALFHATVYVTTYRMLSCTYHTQPYQTYMAAWPHPFSQSRYRTIRDSNPWTFVEDRSP